MDCVVSAETLVTMRGDRLGLVDDGGVAVRDGRIDAVGPAEDLIDRDTTVVEGGVVTPGFVDAHAHTRHAVLRGGAQDVPEIEWMDRALGPLASHLDAATERAGSRLGVLEAVSAGATTLGEYAADVSRLVTDVYRPWGVRVAATETITEVSEDRSDADPDAPYPLDRAQGRAGLERADALADEYADDGLVSVLYGPQAVDMVSPETLAAVGEHARDRGCRVHVHVAQGDRERRQVEARYGADATSVGVLADAGLADEHLLAAHLHGASTADRQFLADAGAAMVGCPGSIAGIDGAVPPLAEYHERGGTVALGTDQAPGPGGHALGRAARTAALLAKTDAGDPTAFPAWVALRAATIGGARALGIDDRVGTLEPGKRADLTCFDTDHPSLAPVVREPFHTAVPNLVYAAGRGAVGDVMVDGEWVVRDGAFQPADPDQVVAEARTAARRVFESATGDWRAADSALVDAVNEGWL